MIASPCIGLCRLGDGDICLGCGRTLPEIAEWSGAGPARQSDILAAAALRRAATRADAEVRR
jgi:hypothetical protein